jgi:hypothetical protein
MLCEDSRGWRCAFLHVRPQEPDPNAVGPEQLGALSAEYQQDDQIDERDDREQPHHHRDGDMVQQHGKTNRGDEDVDHQDQGQDTQDDDRRLIFDSDGFGYRVQKDLRQYAKDQGALPGGNFDQFVRDASVGSLEIRFGCPVYVNVHDDFSFEIKVTDLFLPEELTFK